MPRRSAHAGPSARSPGLSPEAWRALRHAMARLAVDLVSGPAGVAAVLRQGLLDKPYNTPCLPLDIGYSDAIPAHIRRAVAAAGPHLCLAQVRPPGRPLRRPPPAAQARRRRDLASTTASWSASSTTTSASTAAAGSSPCTPTAPPKRAALTADRSSTATRRPPGTQPDGAGSRRPITRAYPGEHLIDARPCLEKPVSNARTSRFASRRPDPARPASGCRGGSLPLLCPGIRKGVGFSG